jgi:hypothetical protein
MARDAVQRQDRAAVVRAEDVDIECVHGRDTAIAPRQKDV